ncbi:MAG TPA: hypothetical protein DCY13_12215 [Verrucomicrobiales bacterium]|nr:hypothetical protein [Verrucomicrobiales bacterium]
MPKSPSTSRPQCGLCGKSGKLVRTPCCGNWICDDQDKYALFSFARNSCARNHDRLTLCGYHHNEGHKGRWQDCGVCRESFETELYVWYGTNEYNFEILADPPAFEPARCDGCQKVIKLGTDGYSTGPRGRLCEACTAAGWSPSPAARSRPRRSSPRRPGASKQPLPVNMDPDCLEIVVSARAAKRLKLTPTVRAGDRPLHWCARWRVEVCQLPDRRWVALVTNAETFYSFVFPVTELQGPGRFEELFRLRLGFALTDAPSLAFWKTAPLRYATGNPRVLVGTMNRMKLDLLCAGQVEESPRVDEEDILNHGICLALDEVIPFRAWARRLK